MIKIKDIILESLPKYIEVISSYVNYNQDKGLLKIKNIVPYNLKSKGAGYHIVALSPILINKIINDKKPIPYPNKKPILSIAKTILGIGEFKTNMENDDVWKYNNSLVIKVRYSLSDCIVDINKFAKQYPDSIHSGHSDYLDEEEIIIQNSIRIITPNMIDGYFLKGVGKKL